MNTQELAIQVNGISRAEILNLVETHGNVAYRYSDEEDKEIEIKIRSLGTTGPDAGYEVEFITVGECRSMTTPEISQAMDWFFDTVEENPANPSYEKAGQRKQSESVNMMNDQIGSERSPLTKEEIANIALPAQIWFAKNFGSAPAHWTNEQVRLHDEFQSRIAEIVRAVESKHGISG